MRYIKLAGVLRIHENIKRDLPVADGKINTGKIEIILEKPRLVLYNSEEKYDTIYKKAACLLEGFCRAHAFPDGNKRTALLVTFAFLQANRYYLVVPLNTVEFLVRVAQDMSKTEEDVDKLISEIAQWIEKRTAKNRNEIIQINKKFVQNPLRRLLVISFTGIGLFYVNHQINKWFATKHHPEYKQSFGRITKFLFNTLDDSKKAFENYGSA